MRDIILNEAHPEFKKYGEWNGIGTVFYENVKRPINTDAKLLSAALPLFPNIKQYPLFFEQADKNSFMYRKILDILTDSGIEHDFSQEPGMPIMGNMWHIAKFGWTSFATAVLNR